MSERPKPTIRELEDILNDPDPPPVEIRPDGTVHVGAAVPPDAPELRERARSVVAHAFARMYAGTVGASPSMWTDEAEIAIAALGEAGLLARSEGEERLPRRVTAKVVLDYRDASDEASTRKPGHSKLLARSEGEAVGLLRRIVRLDDVALLESNGRVGLADCMDNDGMAYPSAGLGAALNEARAFLSRSESRGGPDAPSYGEMAEVLTRSQKLMERAGDAIKSLPEDALGYAEDEDSIWPIRNELANNLMLQCAENHKVLDRLPGAQEPEKT